MGLDFNTIGQFVCLEIIVFDLDKKLLLGTLMKPVVSIERIQIDQQTKQY